MKTEVTEIADKIYRLSTFVPQVGPTGFTFNQFLIDADEPLLFHYGQRALFPLISDAVKRVIPLDEAALDDLQPRRSRRGRRAQPVAGRRAQRHAGAWAGRLQHLAHRHGRPRAARRSRTTRRSISAASACAGSTRRTCRTTGTPACSTRRRPARCSRSDLFTQMGPAEPTTESDIVAPAIATAAKVPFMPWTPLAEPTLRRLAALAHDHRADAWPDVQGRRRRRR